MDCQLSSWKAAFPGSCGLPVQTSLTALIKFPARVQMCVLKLMLSVLEGSVDTRAQELSWP